MSTSCYKKLQYPCCTNKTTGTSNYNKSLKFVLDSIGVALARVVASTIIAVAAGRKSGTTSGQVTDDADHAGGDQEPAEELASSQ